MRLEKLTPAQVRSFLRAKLKEDSARGRPLSPRTVQYLHAVLRLALEHARHDELITRNVASLAKPPQVRQDEVAPYTPEQARTLLRLASQDRLYALYALALGIGLRRGELLGLTWSSVDLDDGTLRVRTSLQRLGGSLTLVDPKTKRSQRTVPLPGFCVDALREHRKRQDEQPAQARAWLDEWDLVFTTSIGTPIEPLRSARGRVGEPDGLSAVQRAGLSISALVSTRRSLSWRSLSWGIIRSGSRRASRDRRVGAASCASCRLGILRTIRPAAFPCCRRRVDDRLTTPDARCRKSGLQRPPPCQDAGSRSPSLPGPLVWPAETPVRCADAWSVALP